jgi:hypothetical protein
MGKERFDGYERLEKTQISFHSLTDEPDDRAYWLSRPVNERFKHIEMLRVMNYGDAATSRISRFFEVVEPTN